MTLWVNGEPRECAEDVTVGALLEALSLTDAMVAVAVNRTFVPKAAHAERTLEEGDHVDIVAPMQGG